MVLNLRKMA